MKAKKIFAREFLILVSTILFLLLVYCALVIRNFYNTKKNVDIANRLYNTENQYQRFLMVPLEMKNKSISQDKLDDFSQFLTNNPTVTNDYIYKLIIELENDSTQLKALFDYSKNLRLKKFNHRKELNLNHPEFFIFKKSDQDSLKYFKKQIATLRIELENSRSIILNDYELKSLIYKFSLWLFLLVFGLRYLFYAINWSIITILSKS